MAKSKINYLRHSTTKKGITTTYTHSRVKLTNNRRRLKIGYTARWLGAVTTPPAGRKLKLVARPHVTQASYDARKNLRPVSLVDTLNKVIHAFGTKLGISSSCGNTECSQREKGTKHPTPALYAA